MSSNPAPTTSSSVSATPWPFGLVLGLGALIVVSTGFNAWQQYEVLQVLLQQGLAPPSSMILFAASLGLVLLAWVVLVRLWFRRSMHLALGYVAVVFLASLLSLALSFEALNLDLLLQALWLVGLALLFRTLLKRLRAAAPAAS